MKFADFRCNHCNEVTEICIKNNLQDFPTTIQCSSCNSENTYRLFGNMNFDVAEGKYGNSKTGYSKGTVYHPSQYGKFKGKKVK